MKYTVIVLAIVAAAVVGTTMYPKLANNTNTTDSAVSGNEDVAAGVATQDVKADESESKEKDKAETKEPETKEPEAKEPEGDSEKTKP